MTNLIFAFMQAYGGDERESLLLAHSLRTFGGELSNCPLWLMVPQNLDQFSESTRQALRELDVQVHRFEVPEEALSFPFGGKVYAAAAAEFLASNEADILVWMDSDTIFAGEPAEFVLGENVSLGYRPVMLKNISSLYDEPRERILGFHLRGLWYAGGEHPSDDHYRGRCTHPATVQCRDTERAPKEGVVTGLAG